MTGLVAIGDGFNFLKLPGLRIIHQTFEHGPIITYENLSAGAEDSVQRSSDIKCCGTFLVVGRVVDEGLRVSRNDVHVHILHTQNASLLVGHYVQGKGALHFSSLQHKTIIKTVPYNTKP